MWYHLHHGNLLGVEINLVGSNLRNLKKSKHLADQSTFAKDQKLKSGEPQPSSSLRRKEEKRMSRAGTKAHFQAGSLIAENKVMVIFSERSASLKCPFPSGTCHHPHITEAEWVREKIMCFNYNSIRKSTVHKNAYLFGRAEKHCGSSGKDQR